MLTVEDVQGRVRLIEELKDDFEVAHDKEEALYKDVLRHIADGYPNGAELAKEALKAEDIEFTRYSA